MMEKKDAIALPQSRIDKAIDESKLPAEYKEQLRPVLREHFGPFEQQAAEWVQQALALVVSDASETDKIAQAKAGAKFLQRVRIDIEKVRKEKGDEHLRKKQFIDLIAGTLTEWLEPAEKHLQQQMKFVELQEKKQRDELRVARRELMKPYRTENDRMDDVPVEDMAEPAFNNLLMGMKVAHETREKDKADLANLRIQQEADAKAERERMARLNARMDQLALLDFKPVGEHYIHEELQLRISKESTIALDDEMFEQIHAGFAVKVNAHNEAKRLEAQRQLQVKNRINALSSMGFMWEEKNKRYTHPRHEFVISVEDVQSISSDDFTRRYNDFRTAIVEHQEREKKLEQRIQRIVEIGFAWDGNNYFVGDFKRIDKHTLQNLSDADFNDVVKGGKAEVERLKEKEAEAARLKLAPDKEQLLAFATQVEALQPPAIKIDPRHHKIATQAKKELDRLANWIRTETEYVK
jgi:hypothetical protein